MVAKTIDIVAIRQRPASCERSSRSTSADDVAANRSVAAPPAPRVLVSSTPLTDNPSSTWTCISASRRCSCAVISLRSNATRRVSQIAGGSTMSESSDSRQLKATMAIAVPTAVVRLDAIEVAVDVTTDCIPPMSWMMRD